MKKIALIFTLLIFTAGMAYGATATETDSNSGYDSGPVVSSVTFNGLPTGASITNTEITTTIGSYVGSWYDMNLEIGGNTYNNVGELDNVSYSDLNGQNPNSQTITVTSVDLDAYSDYVTLTLEVTITYEVPGAPGEPSNPSPADDATGIATSGDITWDFGADTDTYDLWFGEAGSMAEVVTGATAGATGSYSYSGLSNATEYEWQVICHNSTKLSTDGPVWSFTTEAETITTFPYEVGFETWQPTGWTLTSSTDDNWVQDDGTSYGPGSVYEGSYAAMYNNYSISSGNSGSLITPPLDLSSLTSPMLEFYWWNNDAAKNKKNASKAVATLTIATSTDGTNYTDIETIDVYGSGADTWVKYSHTIGTDVQKVKITATSDYGMKNTFIDAFVIKEAPSDPIFAIDPESKDFGKLIAGNSSDPQTFTITNEGGGTLTITNGDITLTGSDAADFALSSEPTYPVNLGAGESATVDVTFSPAAAGAKTADLQIVDNRATTQVPLNGQALPSDYVFEGFETAVPPAGWDVINTQNNDWSRITYGQYEGDGGAQLAYYYSSGYLSSISTLVTPKLDLDGTQTLYFFAKQSTAGQTLKIQYSSDGVTFTDLETITLTDTYQQFTVDLSTLTGEYYLGFYGETTAEYAYIYLDNVYHPADVPVPPEVPTAPDPADEATNVSYTTDLGWSNGYSTETVDVYFGTNETAVTNKEASVKVVDNLDVTTYDAGDLEYNTAYYWRVVCKNSVKAETDGPVWSFTTQENPNYGGGGTGQGGYYFANSTSGASGAPSQPGYSWVDISAGTDVSGDVAADSDVGGPYDFGFTFNYFGTDYTQFYICADGYISLVEETVSDWSNDPIPSAADPNGMICLLWDDMNPGDTSVTGYHLYYGSSGGNMVISYVRMPEFGATTEDDQFTAQAILYPSGNIKLQYKEVGSSFDLSSCTVGIENAAGDAGVQYLYNGTGGEIYSGAKAGEIAVMFGTDENTLPVELIAGSLTAQFATENNYNFVNLAWSTASETDLQGFNVYRGANGNQDEAVKVNANLIPGAGNSTEIQDYSFDDITADVYVESYYWLEIVDFDANSFHGPVKYSPEEQEIPEDIETTVLRNCQPNPVRDEVSIAYQIKGSPSEQNAELRVYNIQGRLVKTVNSDNGIFEFSTSNLSTGIYFYQLKTESFNQIRKMVITK